MLSFPGYDDVARPLSERERRFGQEFRRSVDGGSVRPGSRSGLRRLDHYGFTSRRYRRHSRSSRLHRLYTLQGRVNDAIKPFHAL